VRDGSLAASETLPRLSETLPLPLPYQGGVKCFMNFLFVPYLQALIEPARENRKNFTTAEKVFWTNVLANEAFARFKFLRQKPIDQFIVDFYCAELFLVIEIDGESHARKEEQDELRTERLSVFGIKVIRFTNSEVFNKTKQVIDDLYRIIQTRQIELSQNP